MPKMNDDNDTGGSAIERFRRKQAELEGADDDSEGSDDDSGDPVLSTEPDDSEREVPVVETRSRVEKKRERKRLIEELEDKRRETTELRAAVARLEGRMEVISAIAPTGTPDRTDADPYAAELDRLHNEQVSEHQRLIVSKGASLSQADKDEYLKRAREIDRKRGVIYAKQAMAEEGVQRQDPNAAQGAVMRMQYPDVYANANAVAFAKSYYEMERAAGKKDSKELLDEAMNATRVRFRLGKPPPPSDRQRNQYAGHAPTGGGQRGNDTDEPASIRMTKPLRIMAVARYPNLSEAEAYKRWANNEGRMMLAASKNNS